MFFIVNAVKGMLGDKQSNTPVLGSISRVPRSHTHTLIPASTRSIFRATLTRLTPAPTRLIPGATQSTLTFASLNKPVDEPPQDPMQTPPQQDNCVPDTKQLHKRKKARVAHHDAPAKRRATHSTQKIGN